MENRLSKRIRNSDPTVSVAKHLRRSSYDQKSRKQEIMPRFRNPTPHRTGTAMHHGSQTPRKSLRPHGSNTVSHRAKPPRGNLALRSRNSVQHKRSMELYRGNPRLRSRNLVHQQRSMEKRSGNLTLQSRNSVQHRRRTKPRYGSAAAHRSKWATRNRNLQHRRYSVNPRRGRAMRSSSRNHQSGDSIVVQMANHEDNETFLPEETKPKLEKKISLDSLNDDDSTECDFEEIVYGAGDVIFASCVVAPLVVGVWRGTLGLLDLYSEYFPHAQTFIFGIFLHTCFALLRAWLLARSRGAWSGAGGGAGRWLLERFLSRVYTYIFLLACIMHWRGGWWLFDASIVAVLPTEGDPHRPILIATFAIVLCICIVSLRSARNLLAPPFFVVTDGKEVTYIFTTRFRKTSYCGGRAAFTHSTDMRGSTAGLADTLASGSRAYTVLLECADVVFASLVVAPAVVAYWKSTWTLMDLYVLPDNPVGSAAACVIFGFILGLFLCVFQSSLTKHLSPDKGRLTYYVLSRLSTWVAGAACVGGWRGAWNLLNECTGDSARTVLSTTAAATLSLAALRTLRNICAPPFAIAVDSPKDYFYVPTMFRTSSRETALYVLDCIFSVAVVGSLVVFVWRGSWALLDIFLFPEDPVKSCWASLIVGYGIVIATFALQAPTRWITARLHGAPRLLLADVYHFISFLATVNVWRGFWGMLDIYFFPESPYLSNWGTHIFSLVLLMLLNCSNSVLVRGVYIDAEEPAGECVVFPCHYLRLYFHKERTKKRHKRALATAATRKTEESSLPLQNPEEKV